MDKTDDSIELRPVKKDGEKEASEEKTKVLFDKTGYEEPQADNPLDNIRSDLHSK